MLSLEDQLLKIHQKEKKVLNAIDKQNKKKKIKCSCCNKLYSINQLTAIQTNYYVPPRGCNEGDYWKEDILSFICPKTKIINRLLFDNMDIPYGERNEFKNNPEEQFKRYYKPLFKEIIDSFENPKKWVNNNYIDFNRKKFGLVEKKEQ